MEDDKRAKPQRDHYGDVTDKIIAMLESGMPPWRRPWDPSKAAIGGPLNGASGHRYRGINVLLLSCNPRAWETGDPRWCSYEQARQKGWQVRGGEHGTQVYFFKRVEFDDPDARPGPDGESATRTVPVLRSYTVFHVSQMDNVPAYVAPTVQEAPWREPQAVRAILANSGVTVRVGGERAFYAPSTDHIQIPVAQAFRSPEAWAATALHELGHATGHPSRLNRDLANRFGSQGYAREELRADLASAMVAAELGIDGELEQHASYVANWLEVLRSDKKEIFRAAGDAQRIADWCLDLHPAHRLARQLEAVPVASADQPRYPEPPPVTDFERADEALPDYVRAAGGEVVPDVVADGGTPAYTPAWRM